MIRVVVLDAGPIGLLCNSRSSCKLKHKETVVEGIEHAVDAFLGLFQGTNIGKMVVKLGA